ncbi:hypothetical protein C2S51_013931 [Perilla frutescens var. frutescens]|nr:hypothetical protein C2S51_013931 [Perilla frutescens var. frutescens]
MGGALYVGRSPNGGVSFDLLGIRLNLYCTLDGNMASRDTPPFRGADVIFECGDNEVIFKARTNDYGFSYSFAMPKSVMPFFPLQSNCNIVVNTTLSSCNSTLPSVGGLQSGIKFVGTSLVGNLIVANFVPKGFLYNSSI